MYIDKLERKNIDILDIDNTKVREQQIERLKQLKATRDEMKCKKR